MKIGEIWDTKSGRPLFVVDKPTKSTSMVLPVIFKQWNSKDEYHRINRFISVDTGVFPKIINDTSFDMKLCEVKDYKNIIKEIDIAEIYEKEVPSNVNTD